MAHQYGTVEDVPASGVHARLMHASDVPTTPAAAEHERAESAERVIGEIVELSPHSFGILGSPDRGKTLETYDVDFVRLDKIQQIIKEREDDNS